MPKTRTQYFPLGGGLDVVTPSISVPPGRLLACLNFEPHYNDGYRRVLGYERFDGRPRPHLQTFIGFDLVDATGLTTGTTVTGDTSGTTGTVVGISGNSIAVTKVTGGSGTFNAGEGLNTAAYTIAATPTPTVGLGPDADTEPLFQLATEDEYRGDIAVVPGAGEVLGAWRLRDATYAWRDNVGDTACVMHKASASGWTTTGVTLAHYLKFDAGTDTPGPIWQVGDTVTGLTSGASATIHRLIDWAGGYGTNDATGYLVLTGVTSGPFQNNESLQVGGTTIATANGASAQYAFSTDGEFQFRNHNFAASSTSLYTYGVNGVDDAFEIDENGVVSPILIPTVADLTGVTENNDPPAGKPYLVEVHKNHLFLAYPGGRVVHSVIGLPLNFSGFLNAAEFGLGEEVTGLKTAAGGVLIMTTERDTHGLFGQNITDWEKKLVGERTGGKLFAAQSLDTVYTLDDMGITSTARTDSFGDFIGSTVSQLIQPTINALRPNFLCSTVSRKSNQVRWYFSDDTEARFLIMYVPTAGALNRGTSTELNVQWGIGLYPILVKRIFNCEDENEAERTFFASTDGYVYEDQVGRSFDGAEIESYARTVFNHSGAPSMRKKYRRADVEMSAPTTRTFRINLNYDLSYGIADVPGGAFAADVSSGGGFYDTDGWDEFYWDGQDIATARLQLGGTGENISMLFYNKSAVIDSYILQGVTLHYDQRRLQR